MGPWDTLRDVPDEEAPAGDTVVPLRGGRGGRTMAPPESAVPRHGRAEGRVRGWAL